MQVVGIDFGTTNVRIATWDPDGNLPPEPKLIGRAGGAYMPAVVALRRQPGGGVSIIVGEDADSEREDVNDVIVIRNIKRYALSSDSYVRWHLESLSVQSESGNWHLSWWNPSTRCVEAWGQHFFIWDLIACIMEEAFKRAKLNSEKEWRAGCPVHADLDYRDGLAGVLRQLTGTGDDSWITEEPTLFLTLAKRLGDLDGSYMVYDFGGGSFDCAVAEFTKDDGQMTVYGANGHPLLGGSDIDDALKERLGTTEPVNLLRQSKDGLTVARPSATLQDGTVISLDDVNSTLRENRFVEKSLISVNRTYTTAKTLWKRSADSDDPPIGEVLTRNPNTGVVTHVWQCDWDQLAEDVDGIILFGGPTRSAYFSDVLSAQFGPNKVKSAWDVLPTLARTPDLELVGISMGACYSYDETYAPLYVNRLPVKVDLEDLKTDQKVEYKPYEHLGDAREPFDEYVSRNALSRRFVLVSSSSPGKKIQLTVLLPNGVVVQKAFVDEHIDCSLSEFKLHLVIDRFGRVGVEQRSSYARSKRVVILDDTPWQTDGQREAVKKLLRQQREYAERQRARGMAFVTRPPFLGDYESP